MNNVCASCISICLCNSNRLQEACCVTCRTFAPLLTNQVANKVKGYPCALSYISLISPLLLPLLIFSSYIPGAEFYGCSLIKRPLQLTFSIMCVTVCAYQHAYGNRCPTVVDGDGFFQGHCELLPNGTGGKESARGEREGWGGLNVGSCEMQSERHTEKEEERPSYQRGLRRNMISGRTESTDGIKRWHLHDLSTTGEGS